MKILLAICLLITFGCSTKQAIKENRIPSNESSAAVDISGAGDYFIKVTESRDKLSVRYQLCLIAEPNECEKIGNKLYYSKKALGDLSSSQKWSSAGFAGISIFYGVVGTAILAGEIIGAGPTGGATLLGVGGSSMMVVGGITSAKVAVDMVKRCQLISDDVIDDKPVIMKENTLDIAKNLRELLKKIE